MVGVDVVIDCALPGTRELLEAAFRGLQAAPGGTSDLRSALRYEVVGPRPDPAGIPIRRDDQLVGRALDEAELLWLLDGDLAVEIQTRRRDLYFVHAAVLEAGGRAFMLVAEFSRRREVRHGVGDASRGLRLPE